LRRGAWRIAALDLCDLGWGKELPGYEFPSPFSSKSLSLSLSLDKIEDEEFTTIKEIDIFYSLLLLLLIIFLFFMLFIF
jgi:hypothetical protein